MIPRYQRTVRFFALGEIALLILVVVGIFFNTVSEIRWIEKMVLCSVVGLVIWLRCAVEMIQEFYSAAVLKVPLWRYCLYLLAASVGVWQMASPSVGNRYLIFPISALTLLIAAGFALATVRNYRASRVAAVATKTADQPAQEEQESIPEETEA